MTYKSFPLVTVALVLAVSSSVTALLPAGPADAALPIVFPVIGPATFSNDYHAPRASGPHHATDIFAKKGQKVVSPVSGTITYVPYPEPSWGWAVFIRSDGGYEYSFIHLNNDTPGTDNGRGGAMQAYAPDMQAGNRVVRGQLLGYVGDSGNAETTPPHLHFEIARPDGSMLNPYDSLRAAPRLKAPASYPALAGELLPHGATFRGGANLALGNLDSDAPSELVTGAGPGGGPIVKLYGHDRRTQIRSFYAYGSGFKGGVDVAMGDVTGDSTEEIITGAGPGGGPVVRVFSREGTQIGSFVAYAPDFKGGVRVSAGDVTGDGTEEIITGAGAGMTATVKAFTSSGTQLASFAAYGSAFRGGIDVASADVTGDAKDEIITGTGPDSVPSVRTFAANGAQLASFYAYEPSFSGGVRLDAANVQPLTPKAEIVTVPASKGSPRLVMRTHTGVNLQERRFIEEWWQGGYQVGAADGASVTSAGGNRRTTVRAGF